MTGMGPPLPYDALPGIGALAPIAAVRQKLMMKQRGLDPQEIFVARRRICRVAQEAVIRAGPAGTRRRAGSRAGMLAIDREFLV
jgi:hypothetical protein